MNEIQDNYLEHQLHSMFDEDCSSCYSEDTDNIICNICLDTGLMEIMGGTDQDEWTVVGYKPCVCQLLLD